MRDRASTVNRLAARILVVGLALMTFPLPAPTASAFNTGQAVDEFYWCDDVNWQHCNIGYPLDNVTVVKTGQSSNEESSKVGFRFPARGVAASADFDVHTEHGYKVRTVVENSQGQWNQPGVNASNTTSLFGLRIDLDGQLPNGPSAASPFQMPTTTNPNSTFSTGLNNYDVTAGDFDGDGDDDIAVLATSSIQVRRWSGNNWLNFTSYAIPTGVPNATRAADLNGDGRTDIVVLSVINSRDAYLYCLVQLPWGGMRLEGPLTMITGGTALVTDMAVGDLTADGKVDVAVSFTNRTVYWMNQGGANNLDFWGASTYSIKLQSLLYSNAPSSIKAAPPPCNATVATGNLDGRIFVYWQSNFTQLATLVGHASSVTSIAWSPDCAYLASTSTDKSVLLWQTSNWTLAANVTGHSNQAFAVAFSPDSTLLASGGADSNVIVWNVTSLPPTMDANVSEANGTVYALAFSPNLSYLAVGTGGFNIRIHATSDYNTTVANLQGASFAVTSLAFAPNGTELAAGSQDNTVALWDMDLFTRTGRLTEAGADVNAIAYNENGTRLLAASSDGHVRLYDGSNWSVMDDIVEGSTFVYGTAFSRNGEFVLTGGTNNYLRMWDRSTLVSLGRSYTGQEFSVLTLGYSSDGRLAVGSEDGTVAVIALSNGSVVSRFRAHDGALNRLSWSPDASLLATGGSDGIIHVFDTGAWSYAANITLFGNITGVQFADSGTVLAASNATGGIGTWTVPLFTSIRGMQSAQPVNFLALDPTGTQLAVAGTDAVIRIFDIAAGWNFQNLTASGNQRAVDWSPDGTMVAAGGTNRQARTWWTSNWTANSITLQHSGEITSLSFAPDSQKFATGGLDQRIFAYNRTGAVVQQYGSAPAGATLINAIAWSPDARTVAAGWHSLRFPSTRVNVCTSGTCGSQVSFYGIAIGQADSVAGNDIVIAANYRSAFGGSDSGIFKLGFSGGLPSSYTAIAPVGSNLVGDAYRVALGDLTGDGRNDVAAAADTVGSGSLYLIGYVASNNTWDTFNIATIPIGGSVNELAIADVTDDGHNDVVIASGTGHNQIQVAYFEPTARMIGQLQIVNASRMLGAVVGDAPTGFAVGHFNNDTLLDVVSANGAAASVWVWLQKDQVFATFTSQRITDAVFVGDPMVSARLWWEDWNVVPGITAYNFSVSVNNGFTWIPVEENVTLDLNGTNSTVIQYRVEFWADRAGITAWVLSVNIDYTVETTPLDLSMDILRDFTPSNGECYWPGITLGDFHCSFSPSIINQYVLDNWGSQDANGTIYMPIRIRWQRPATVVLTNISIPYNKWPAAPELVSPPADSFVDATPTFVVRADDSDSDNIRYHVQVATDPGFLNIVRSFNQNESALGWGLPFYVAGADATVTTPDAARFNNGERYYWRAAGFDGLQWSDFSPVMNFTVDDLAPDGFATSPAFSTTETFTVSWTAVDPVGGAGLAAQPFDVQFKDGIDGLWTDLVTATNVTSTNYHGENGHIYCFRMRAVDAAGNGQLFTVSLTGDTCTIIDTDRPTATVLDLPQYQTSRNFEVSWGGTDGAAGSGVGGFDVEVQPEGGVWAVWLTAYGGTTAVYSAPDDRVYTFRVAAIDRAGNVGVASAAVSTQVDTTPPVCQVSVGAATITSLSEIAATMSCADIQTPVASYEYCVGTGPSLCDEFLPARAAAPVPLITNLSLANGGTYYVSLHGLNAAGGWSGWVASGAVRVVIPGPASHIEYPQGVLTLTHLNVTFGSSDAFGYRIVAGELQYRRSAFRYNQLGDWQDWLTVVVDPEATGYEFLEDSVVRGYAYEFRFRARNEVGSWGDYAAGSTLYVNHLPVAAGGPDRVVNISEEVLLDATASLDYDGDRDTLTYHWELDDGTVFTTPTASVRFATPGTHRATLTVNDGHEDSVAVITIEVRPDVPRPILPGFEGPAALLGLLVAVAALARREPRRRA